MRLKPRKSSLFRHITKDTSELRMQKRKHRFIWYPAIGLDHTLAESPKRVSTNLFFFSFFFLEMTLSKCHRWFPFKGCSSYDFTSRSVPVRDFYTSLYFKTKFVDHSDGSRRDVKDNRIDNYFTQL